MFEMWNMEIRILQNCRPLFKRNIAYAEFKSLLFTTKNTNMKLILLLLLHSMYFDV